MAKIITPINNKDRLPIVDGRRYLDTSGNSRSIVGKTKRGDHLVWSLNGDWYYRDNGEYYVGDVPRRNSKKFYGLVSLPPELEIRFLEELDASFRASNPPEKLRLIAENLDNIKRRLAELRGAASQ